jgi:nucleoid DNA-binding protein
MNERRSLQISQISADNFTFVPELLKPVNFFLIFVWKMDSEMDITAFIRELLFSHDCVIIPGFGGFIGNYTPARIDKNSSTFYPPLKLISFNRNLNNNDGLLVGRISDSAKTGYGDARNIVEEFVTSLRRKLERGEKVTFDNIGSFTNNQEGNVQFEPDRNVNYHLDSYGLDSFRFLPVEGYDVRKRIGRHIDKGPVQRTVLRKVIWRAAIIIPLLAVIVAIPFKNDIFKPKIEAGNLNPLVTAEFENNKKAVDENSVPLSVTPEVVSPQPTASTQEIVAPPAEPEYNYCLITGSFRARSNAESQAEMLKEEGYTPEIINGPNGFFRVSAMKCTDLSAALGKKESISGKYKGTWIKKI